MPATLKSVREKIDVRPTPEGGGLQMTITIRAYDNGMVKVGNRPISQRRSGEYDPGQSWLGASEYIALALSEFQRQVTARQEQASAQEGTGSS